MAELVDAPGSGPGGGNTVEVRVLFSAPGQNPRNSLTGIPGRRGSLYRIERMAQDDGFVAIGACGNHVDRNAAGLLDALEVMARIRGQILETSNAHGTLRPAWNFLVNWLAAGRRVGTGGQNIDALAAEVVTNADLQRLHPVEHIQLGDAQAGHAVDLNRALERRRVEPAAASRPPRHRAEFLPPRAQ